MLERLGLNLDIKSGALTSNPRNGPMVFIPIDLYSILDGLVRGNIFAQKRNDFRILAHNVFRESKE